MGMLAGTLETDAAGRPRPQDSYLVCVHDSLECPLSPFALIAVTILQACATATTTTQCAKPTLSPPGVSGPVHSVTVRIATATTGAYLCYTLDRSTPTGGPSGHGTKILASSGKVTFPIGHKTLKAIAYKAGWTT